jgi:hypothetical protein
MTLPSHLYTGSTLPPGPHKHLPTPTQEIWWIYFFDVSRTQVPLDTNHFVTMWLPFRPIRAHNDSGLLFASGSHRDFALPYWHAALETFDLGSRGYTLEDAGGLALGDVTWHAGWTLHYSHPAPHSPPRLALAASYFAADRATVLPQVRFFHTT